ncbi:U3 small nucleolar RNA-associated protein 14 like protein A [Pteropus alecto]|uniref:U3 small nucleolar RNA-associated protein 14 like protein A n=1 Tax=Pteropus alecto TaxID=9402 RepID=L5KMX8_PTEAL|nr:U3 small nucleolar RNA-associated protein 14 like protein A [Pteropus alecto]
MMWAAESLQALSEQKELEDLPKDYPSSTSEDEGESNGERKHQKLLEAISSLDGKNRKKLAERSEASLKVSEFTVSSEGSGEKLVLSDLLEPVKTSSSLAIVKKQLHRVKSKKTVELPLNKEEVERIHREVAFSKTSQALSKWDPIVLKNRQAEQLVFPLRKEQSAFAPIEHVLSGWKARTPLEREVFNLLHKNKQPVTDPLLTPVEKASLNAMSLEEAKVRRAELQKARALQSYYEAKARREKKIKSKKYHKVLKKGKAKKALKDFEKLRKVNPTAALEELEKLEKARMMERMSLKHQNSGKWAKSKAIMAKYDLEARQAMQEQLARNKELMQKLQVTSESEEERGTEEEDDFVPDAVNEVQMTADGPNPWMVRNHSGDAKEAEIQKDPEKLREPVADKASESEEEERPVEEEEILLKEFEERRLFRKKSGLNQDTEPVGRQETKGSSSQEMLSELRTLSQKLNNKKHQSRKQKVSSVRTVLLVQRERPAGEEEEPLLLQRPERAKTLEKLEELGKEGCFQNKECPGPALKGQQLERNPDNQPGAPKEKKRKEQMIDLQNILTTKSPSVKSLAVPTTIEELGALKCHNLKFKRSCREPRLLRQAIATEPPNHKISFPEDFGCPHDNRGAGEQSQGFGTIVGDQSWYRKCKKGDFVEDEQERDQKQMIKEAFAGDDVIRDFLKEKREAVEASKPKDMDLTLPGWGEWGGLGLKPSAKKRCRFLIKAPEGLPRKDKALPNVIINEKRNIHAAAHQVRMLPYPFTHHQQFERTIQTPIGSMWNTQRAFQKLTTPKIVTKPGHIIKPIKAEDVGYRSSSRSDLSVIPRNPKRPRSRSQKTAKEKL